EHLLQEAAGHDLLLRQGVLHALAGVNEEAERERQIGLGSEVLDGLRPSVFQQVKAIFVEVWDHHPVLVLDGKLNVYQVHSLAKDWDFFLSSLWGSLLISGGRLLGNRRICFLRKAASPGQESECKRECQKTVWHNGS